MIFLFLEDFCSHLKKASKEERENWLSSLSGMVTGDLFLLVSVCNYPPYTECAITWQRKVLYAPCHVWFSAITYHLTLSSSEVQALSSLLCTQCHIKKKQQTTKHYLQSYFPHSWSLQTRLTRWSAFHAFLADRLKETPRWLAAGKQVGSSWALPISRSPCGAPVASRGRIPNCWTQHDPPAPGQRYGCDTARDSELR